MSLLGYGKIIAGATKAMPGFYKEQLGVVMA